MGKGTILNFILERLPQVGGVPPQQRNQVMGAAHFLRGYSYFVALYTFGGVPQVLTTNIEDNRNIPRASEDDILQLILDDFEEALNLLPQEPANAGFAGEFAVRAALAEFLPSPQVQKKSDQYSFYEPKSTVGKVKGFTTVPVVSVSVFINETSAFFS